MTRREEILEVAVRVVESEGIGALSVRRIAAESGIGPTTLRNYFPSQGELRVAVLQRLAEGWVEDGDIGDPARPALDRLASCLDQFLVVDDARRTEVEMFLRVRESPDAFFAVMVEEAYAKTTEAVERWLSVLVDEGHLREERLRATAAAIVTFIDGLSMRYVNGFRDPAEDLRQRLRDFLELVLA